MSDENVTLGFAEAVRDWRPTSPEAGVISRMLLLDGLAVAAAGAHEHGPALMARQVSSDTAGGSATVIGHQFRTAPPLAARINGMSMHVLDYEPMWKPANHAVSPLLPALLALAESRERAGARPQGGRILRAMVKGVEVQGRLRLASGQLEPKNLTLHPPGAVGAIATAAACAEMLDLDARKMATAMGIAASRCAGLLANVGTMTKALHCGDAASNGLESALLAEAGFTAALDVLGDPRGYGQTYFRATFDTSHITRPLAEPRIVDPGPAWKFFPSQYATHFCIAAALDCATEIEGPESIRAVEIVAPEMPYIDRPQPRSGLDGKFSLQYGAALALLDRRIGLRTFSDERRFSSDVDRILGLTTLRSDPSIPGVFDAMHVEVTVTLGNGRCVRRRCDAPYGNWKRPAAPERIEGKARELLQPVIGADRTDEFIREVRKDADEISVSRVLSLA